MVKLDDELDSLIGAINLIVLNSLERLIKRQVKGG